MGMYLQSAVAETDRWSGRRARDDDARARETTTRARARGARRSREASRGWRNYFFDARARGREREDAFGGDFCAFLPLGDN